MPTVTRLADDRASQFSDEDVDDEIIRRLRKEASSRAEFAKVHACVASGDVPDDREVRLVILGPEHPHGAKDAHSPARKEAAAILESRGAGPRNYKNMLVFLAGDATRLRELRQAARQFLAWSSIVRDGSGENPALNLDSFQKRQADTKRDSADETVESRIPETYQWLLVPGQSDPKGDVEWTEIRSQGSDSLAARAAKKLKNEDLLMVQLGGTRLRQELDRVPLWRGNHVGVKQLCEDVARYLYLPRLRDENVLLAGIHDGLANLHWRSETFAYAESWGEARERYNGLRAGQSVRVVVGSQSLLVKSEIAAAQLEAESQTPTHGPTTANPTGGTGPAPIAVGPGNTNPPSGEPAITPPLKLGRFHGSVHLDPVRLGRDASRIAEEVVQHLTAIVGASVEVALDIHAQLPDGAGDKLVRDITENCRTLRFDNHGFEEH